MLIVGPLGWRRSRRRRIIVIRVGRGIDILGWLDTVMLGIIPVGGLEGLAGRLRVHWVRLARRRTICGRGLVVALWVVVIRSRVRRHPTRTVNWPQASSATASRVETSAYVSVSRRTWDLFPQTLLCVCMDNDSRYVACGM